MHKKKRQEREREKKKAFNDVHLFLAILRKNLVGG